MTRDAGGSLRTASALRRLCLSLPHLATPAEVALIGRFERLVAAPGRATAADAEALAAGWRAWWRAGRVSELSEMAREVERAVIDGDRRLATYAVAAEAACAEAAVRGDAP